MCLGKLLAGRKRFSDTQTAADLEADNDGDRSRISEI